jgi:septum formation protein
VVVVPDGVMNLRGLFSELVLASTSGARRQLMNGLGIPYRAIAPEVDEDVPGGTSPAQAVALLAERKARAVLARLPTALVIGADQLVSLDGAALGKPENAESAKAQIRSLVGRTHEICTGLCVVGPGFVETDVEIARLTVAPHSEAELEAYVACREWEGCAGGYRIEGRGQALFSQIEGDRTAIQGLPMQRLVRMLREAKVRFFV